MRFPCVGLVPKDGRSLLRGVHFRKDTLGKVEPAEREDAARTRLIESRGYRLIRFWNNEVLGNIEGVVAEIERVLADMPSPSPSREREGNT